MPHPQSMYKAANRNWSAAEKLQPHNQVPAVAGYLYGFAAECAIKYRLRDYIPAPAERGGPHYEHFPKLRAALKDSLEGRGATELMRFAEDSFMHDWDILIRYSDGTGVTPALLARWRENARAALEVLE